VTVRKKCPEKALPGAVVANKVDLEERARVHSAEGSEFARANNLNFFQVSAYRNTGVEAPFSSLAEVFATSYEDKRESVADL